MIREDIWTVRTVVGSGLLGSSTGGKVVDRALDVKGMELVDSSTGAKVVERVRIIELYCG